MIDLVDLDEPELGEIINQTQPLDISDLPAQQTEPYDPNKALDHARKNVAYLLIWLLVSVCGFTLIALAFGAPSEVMLHALELLLSPITALVGAATGFYFGTRSS
ncbi:hypothetical protein [Xanthomonas euvesicatoria]|uniref:hypothetical protein n=1 Tax=Xanthomonas euvesicatoria TaxID=456327 RepID=UPI003A0FE01E